MSQDTQTSTSCLQGSEGEQVGPDSEGRWTGQVPQAFLAGLPRGYGYASAEAERCLAGLHRLGTNVSVALPVTFLSRALLKSVQLLPCPVKPSRLCEGLTTQGGRGQFSLPVHQGCFINN